MNAATAPRDRSSYVARRTEARLACTPESLLPSSSSSFLHNSACAFVLLRRPAFSCYAAAPHAAMRAHVPRSRRCRRLGAAADGIRRAR